MQIIGNLKIDYPALHIWSGFALPIAHPGNHMMRARIVGTRKWSPYDNNALYSPGGAIIFCRGLFRLFCIAHVGAGLAPAHRPWAII
jgi:hypothetical protein